MNLLPAQAQNYILVDQIQDPVSGQLIPLVEKSSNIFHSLFKPKPVVRPKINFHTLHREICTALNNHGILNISMSQGVYGHEMEFKVYHSHHNNKVDIENLNGVEVFVSSNDAPESTRPYCSTLKIPVQGTYMYILDKYPVALLTNEKFIMYNNSLSHQNIMLNHWYIEFHNQIEVNYFIQRMGLLLACI